MIDRDDGEQLSAWLDGEYVPARVVLDLLGRPEGVACVREVLRVRAALEQGDATAGEAAVARIDRAIARARWSARIPGLGWVAAAAASAGLVLVLTRPAPATATATATSIPRADLVARFPTR